MDEKISFTDGAYAALRTNNNVQSALNKTDDEIKNLKESVSDLYIIHWGNTNNMRRMLTTCNESLDFSTKAMMDTLHLREKIISMRLDYAKKFDEMSHKNNVLTVMVVVQYIALALLALCR